MKFAPYIIIVCFSLILVLPAFNSLTDTWHFERKDENRVFRDHLDIVIYNLDVFPSQAEEYVNDNFSFRTPLLEMYHQLKFRLFKISPHPDKMVVGKNDWYYVFGKETEQYEGKRNFSDEQLDFFLTEWTKRTNYFDSLGIKPYWLIGPLKHEIYSEHLPINIIKKEGPTRMEQIKQHLAPHFPKLIIDPTEAFMAAKSERKLYFQLDNHWTFEAGDIAARLLRDRIQQDFPNKDIAPVPDYEWEDHRVDWGIHHRVIGISDLFEIAKYPIKEGQTAHSVDLYGFPIPPDFPYPKEYEMRYVKENDSSGLRILFIRDSFCVQLIAFVKESFKESVFIFDYWRYNINEPIVEEVKPDIVVFLSTESLLDNYIKKYAEEEKE